MESSNSVSVFLKNRFLTLETKKFMMLCILLFAISIPLAIFAFNRVMLAGHPTSFSPSDPRLGFRKGPASRGTLNIISACLSTIFTCIYVSLHLNIPSQPTDQNASDSFCCWLKNIWHWLKNLTIIRKVIWMGVNCVCPEILVGVAAWEYSSARVGVNYMRTNDHEGWTLTHAFFMDMGGFKVQDRNPHSWRVLRSGAEFYQWFSMLDGNKQSIDFEQILLDINDRSKADTLLKTFTCLQASWLVVQTVVRAFEKRPVSELELTTCAYVVCTLVTYLFWWHKPYNVRQHVWSTLVQLRPMRVASESLTPFERFWNWMKSCLKLVMQVFRPNVARPTTKLPLPKQAIEDRYSWPFNRSGHTRDIQNVFIIAAAIGAGVGVIHCGLWNTLFVNSNGQLLWRICCSLQIASPLIEATQALLPKVPSYLHAVTLIFVGISYCSSRVVVVLLIIMSFRSLPAGVYTDIDWTWTAFPHWH